MPLSSPAVARSRMVDIIVPRMRLKNELPDMSLTAVLRRMGRPEIPMYRFRSTFRDWCAKSAGNSFPREVCKHALAHSLHDKVEAAYRRGNLIDRRKVLMQIWAD